jgi:hypothetical protein
MACCFGSLKAAWAQGTGVVGLVEEGQPVISAMSNTCLQMKIWNIFGTFVSARWTISQSTWLKCPPAKTLAL